MVPINKQVIPNNNTIMQLLEGKMATTYGLKIFVDYINSNNKLPDVQYLAVKPMIDGRHTWPHRELRGKKLDFIRYIPKKYIIRMQRKQLVLIFDIGAEAFDPVDEIEFWRVINHNVKKYKLHKNYVWYLSSNVRDRARPEKREFLIHSEHFWANNIVDNTNVDNAFEETVNSTIKHIRPGAQLFSSLHGRSKLERHWWHYKLFKNNLDQYGMISNPNVDFATLQELQNLGESKYHTQRWAKTLPREVDKQTKHLGWEASIFRLEKDYRILDRSAFHIVNESYVDTKFKINLISEKTFKTFARFTPSIILGINDTTRHLTEMGYKDLSFMFGLPERWDKHPLDWRYDLALKAVKLTVEKLSAMTTAQVIDWKFRHEAELKINYNVLQQNSINKKWRDEFIQIVETAYEKDNE